MKYGTYAAGLLAMVLAAPLALFSQSASPASPPTKIGIISVQAIIDNTAEGKKAYSELQKKFQPRQQQLQQMGQEIQGLQDQLQRQAATLSDEERLRLQRELEDKQKIFKRTQEDAQADLQSDQQDIGRRIYQKLSRLLNEYAQQNGFAVVMEANPQLLHYVGQGVDLTEEMVKKYDAANPVEAADTPAAGASGAKTTPAGGAKPATKPAVPPKPKQP